MELTQAILYVPLIALLAGAVAGFAVGRFLAGGWLWALPGLLSALSLALIVWLATVSPGEEETAFLPFVALTGAVLPALLTVIMGTMGGRALRKRAKP